MISKWFASIRKRFKRRAILRMVDSFQKTRKDWDYQKGARIFRDALRFHLLNITGPYLKQ